MSIDRGTHNDVIYIYSGKLLSYKKEENNAICSHMDGPRDRHTEWSKSNTERQINMTSFICGIFKKGISELRHKTEVKS